MAKDIKSIIEDLHPSLLGRLKLAHEKPVMITITYMNSKRKLQHWAGFSGRFIKADIPITLKALDMIIANSFEGDGNA
jgi:hypothetical protein